MEKHKVICGIQQVGIGVSNVIEAWKWYYDNFGYELKIVDDEGVAERMLPYTGGKPQPRRAMMVFNKRGGGGFEVWQPKGRALNYLKQKPSLGDIGIFACKIKTADIQCVYDTFVKRGHKVLTPISDAPNGLKHFFMYDPYDNLFEIEEDNYIFINDKTLLTGGSNGVIIGVSDIKQSIEFYSKVFDYDKVAYEVEGVFEDLKGIVGGEQKVKRVLLERSKPIEGPLSALMGTSHIELIQLSQGEGVKLYKNRLWGDPGFIHLCFDIRNMDEIKKVVESLGHPFVCDSGKNFDMGTANGHFTYVEDPDGTLIEFVETLKVPLMKGVSINMAKKDDKKQLCPMLMKALRFAKVKRSKIK